MAVSSLPKNTDVEVFEFAPEGALPATVRVIQDEQGESCFMLADACQALGLARGASQVLNRLPDDEVRRTYPITDSLGREQYPVFVTLSGWRVMGETMT